MQAIKDFFSSFMLAELLKGLVIASELEIDGGPPEQQIGIPGALLQLFLAFFEGLLDIGAREMNLVVDGAYAEGGHIWWCGMHGGISKKRARR